LKQLRACDDDQNARASAGTFSIDPPAQKFSEERSIILTTQERFRVQLGALSLLQSLHQSLPIHGVDAGFLEQHSAPDKIQTCDG